MTVDAALAIIANRDLVRAASFAENRTQPLPDRLLTIMLDLPAIEQPRWCGLKSAKLSVEASDRRSPPTITS